MDRSVRKIVIEGADLMFEQSPDLSPRSPWHYAYLMGCVMKLCKTIVRFETNHLMGACSPPSIGRSFCLYSRAIVEAIANAPKLGVFLG